MDLSDKDQFIVEVATAGIHYWVIKEYSSSRQDGLNSKDLRVSGRYISDILAEYMAIYGMTAISFQPLRDTIEFVDGVAEGLYYDDVAAQKIMADLEGPMGVMDALLEDFKQAGKTDANGNGAPLAAYLFLYAKELIHICEAVVNQYDYGEKDKRYFFDVIRRQARKLADPGLQPGQ